eukprot:161036-Pelagomonas_calceolata.AAC.10
MLIAGRRLGKLGQLRAPRGRWRSTEIRQSNNTTSFQFQMRVFLTASTFGMQGWAGGTLISKLKPLRRACCLRTVWAMPGGPRTGRPHDKKCSERFAAKLLAQKSTANCRREGKHTRASVCPGEEPHTFYALASENGAARRAHALQRICFPIPEIQANLHPIKPRGQQTRKIDRSFAHKQQAIGASWEAGKNHMDFERGKGQLTQASKSEGILGYHFNFNQLDSTGGNLNEGFCVHVHRQPALGNM